MPPTAMTLLIDGYNMLNATGISGPIRSGVGSLERSRLALLNFLADALTPEEALRTTVVFDAQRPPPGLPRVLNHRGLTVRFASQYPDADSLLEELIRAEHVPRRLTVVSSDHRLQRAARRRRARAVDSEAWYQEILDRRRKIAAGMAEPANARDHQKAPEVENPFPPGYAEDLLAEEGNPNPFPDGYGDGEGL